MHAFRDYVPTDGSASASLDQDAIGGRWVMEKVRVEEFLQPKAMLTPGIAGGVTMLIANALWVAFSLPPRWTSLVLSFLLGLLVFVATTRVPVWQRAVYYLLNSLIIFSVSIGTNYVGVGVTRPPHNRPTEVGRLGPPVHACFSGIACGWGP